VEGGAQQDIFFVGRGFYRKVDRGFAERGFDAAAILYQLGLSIEGEEGFVVG